MLQNSQLRPNAMKSNQRMLTLLKSSLRVISAQASRLVLIAWHTIPRTTRQITEGNEHISRVQNNHMLWEALKR
jgi:hypothetical protein